MPAAPPEVADNPAASRFELRVGDQLGFLNYRRDGNLLHLIHTEVPPEIEGEGYGSALARGALEYARTAGLQVVPSCRFVRAYLERHPEYAPLVAAR
jgi:uncharacterized protein